MMMLSSPPVDCYFKILLLSTVTARYSSPTLIPQDDAVSGRLIVVILIFLLSLSPLVATLCRCWYRMMMLLPSLPVDCCYLKIIILSPLAALLCWFCEMLLLPSPPVDCCHLIFFCCRCHRSLHFADADTARWCCLCRRMIVAILISLLFVDRLLHCYADTGKMLLPSPPVDCCYHNFLIHRSNFPRSPCKKHLRFLLTTCCSTMQKSSQEPSQIPSVILPSNLLQQPPTEPPQ